MRGRGAKLNGSPLKIPYLGSSSDPLSGHVVSTELAAHLAWPRMLEMLHLLGQRHCTMRIMGSGTMTLVAAPQAATALYDLWVEACASALVLP